MLRLNKVFDLHASLAPHRNSKALHYLLLSREQELTLYQTWAPPSAIATHFPEGKMSASDASSVVGRRSSVHTTVDWPWVVQGGHRIFLCRMFSSRAPLWSRVECYRNGFDKSLDVFGHVSLVERLGECGTGVSLRPNQINEPPCVARPLARIGINVVEERQNWEFGSVKRTVESVQGFPPLTNSCVRKAQRFPQDGVDVEWFLWHLPPNFSFDVSRSFVSHSCFVYGFIIVRWGPIDGKRGKKESRDKKKRISTNIRSTQQYHEQISLVTTACCRKLNG